jgi:NAD(P)-dependent dehydrogenase (short-subunit alcohol dehydrogenase family)
MDLNLANKLALISGSTAGIGYAIAEALVREGARVIIDGRSQKSVNDALSRLKVHGDAVGLAANLSTASAAEQLAKEFPDVEILITNLGIFEPKPFEDIPDADWQRFFEVNVLGGVRFARGWRRREKCVLMAPNLPTNRRRHSFNTGGSIGGGVLTYELGGKQYVATTSGVVSGFFGGSGTSSIIVFALP